GARGAGAGAAGALYAGAAAWVAFNVPVARIFSTPLAWTMLGAAGTALLDSIRAYVTPANLAAMALVLAAAAAAPPLVARLQKRTVVLFTSRPARVAALVLLAGAWAALVALGPLALRRVPT